MAKRKPLGMDELMIVNPSPAGSGAYFLGEDGSLYQIQGLDLDEGVQPARALFLGEDGVLYQGRVSDGPAGISEVPRPSLGETQERAGPSFSGKTAGCTRSSSNDVSARCRNVGPTDNSKGGYHGKSSGRQR